MKLGNTGGKNKGKKYLKITGRETITPQNQAKANLFKEWFSKNYTRMQTEMIDKRTFDEDMFNETFLRIYEKILYGGLAIDNYKAYFHRAFFTNYVQESMKKLATERILVSDEYAVDTLDETLSAIEEQQQKLDLYHEVLKYVRERFDEPCYKLFVAYVELGNRRYEVVADATDIPHKSAAKIIGKIKRSIRKNPRLIHTRKQM